MDVQIALPDPKFNIGDRIKAECSTVRETGVVVSRTYWIDWEAPEIPVITVGDKVLGAIEGWDRPRSEWKYMCYNDQGEWFVVWEQFMRKAK